jgi:hypothetical protein
VPGAEDKQPVLTLRSRINSSNGRDGTVSADGNHIAQRIVSRGLSEFEEGDEDEDGRLEGIVGAARGGAGSDDDEFDF